MLLLTVDSGFQPADTVNITQPHVRQIKYCKDTVTTTRFQPVELHADTVMVAFAL